jgi:DNA polymerase-3 subunit delta'
MPFRDIAGHKHLLDLVAGAATRGSLPPSLIFAGPEGVGKRKAAVALAQLLNCLKRPVSGSVDSGLLLLPEPDMVGSAKLGLPEPGEDACGVCAACTRIARNVHADVLIVEPGDTGAIKVDQIRDAIDRTGFRPFEGRKRVVIIDDADATLVEAQNALLKTLEEPPTASMFVLVTSRPDILLPTVRSRCQRLRFGRLSASDIAAVLIKQHGYEPADAHAAASAADGSIGLALEGASGVFTEARAAAAELLQRVAGTSDVRRRLEGAKALAGVGDRDEVRRRLRALASMLRDLGALVSQADERYLANADLLAMLRRLTASFDGERIANALGAVDRAFEAIDRNASPKIVSDWLAFQL